MKDGKCFKRCLAQGQHSIEACCCDDDDDGDEFIFWQPDHIQNGACPIMQLPIPGLPSEAEGFVTVHLATIPIPVIAPGAAPESISSHLITSFCLHWEWQVLQKKKELGYVF